MARSLPAAATRFAALQRLIACGFGSGYAPFAPGTFGSLPGVLFAALLLPHGNAAIGAGIAAATLLGFWSAGPVARDSGHADPGLVVVDEIAGQMLTFSFHTPDAWTLFGGFFLFRLFDIWKPFPARRLEALPGSSGIMLDDLVAGAYACIVLHGIRWSVLVA